MEASFYRFVMKETILLEVDSERPDIEKIRIAANFIISGGLVAFPTETVYGLGANALNASAVLSVFAAKKRPLDNPPIVHVSDMEGVGLVAEKVGPKAKKLMATFWPGPLTLILNRSRALPNVAVAGLNTVAVRMPRHNVALALIRASGVPISAPSANLSGKPSPTTARHVLDDLAGRIDAVLDSGPTSVGLESTVLDLTVNPPEVLRPGSVTLESLHATIGTVRLSYAAAAEKPLSMAKVRSPGVMHKHYSPDAAVIVVEGQMQYVPRKVQELALQYMHRGNKVGVLGTDETVGSYRADLVKSLGGRVNMAVIASNLFACLRELDREGVDVIIAEGMPMNGMGLAVMNRLRRAAGYRIVKAKPHLKPSETS
jgi:L-threonylcarbamoyladenylate synthase